MRDKSIHKLSPSDLKLLDKHPRLLKKKMDGEEVVSDSRLLKIGTGVDILLTREDPGKELAEEFELIDPGIKPKGQMLDLVHKVSETVNAEKVSESQISFEDILYSCYNEVGFKRDSFEKIKERFEEEAREYFEKLTSSSRLITVDDEYRMHVLAEKLEKDPMTSHYLKNDEESELYFQKELSFSLDKDITCEGIADIVRVDHKNKKVHIIDIKVTSYSISNPMKLILDKRYDLQMRCYTKGLLSSGIAEKFGYYIGNPIMLFVNEPWEDTKAVELEDPENKTERGGYVEGRYIKGIDYLLDDYKFHISEDLWNHRKEVYENGREIVSL